MKLRIVLGENYGGGGPGYHCQEKVALECTMDGSYTESAQILGYKDVAVGTECSAIFEDVADIESETGMVPVIFTPKVVVRRGRPSAEGVVLFENGTQLFLAGQALQACLLQNSGTDSRYFPAKGVARIPA